MTILGLATVLTAATLVSTQSTGGTCQAYTGGYCAQLINHPVFIPDGASIAAHEATLKSGGMDLLLALNKSTPANRPCVSAFLEVACYSLYPSCLNDAIEQVPCKSVCQKANNECLSLFTSFGKVSSLPDCDGTIKSLPGKLPFGSEPKCLGASASTSVVIASPPGKCQTYPGGYCSNFANYPIFVADDNPVTATEKYLKSGGMDLLLSLNASTPANRPCVNAYLQWACYSFYPSCSADSVSAVTCKSVCENTVSLCTSMFTMFGKASSLPKCDGEVPHLTASYSSDGQCLGASQKPTVPELPSAPMNVTCPSFLIVNPAYNASNPRQELPSILGQTCAGTCCVPCPLIVQFYEPSAIDALTVIIIVTALVSAVGAGFTFLSYIMFPKRRVHPGCMMMYFSGGAMVLHFAQSAIISGGGTGIQCVDAITEARVGNSVGCPLQGFLVSFFANYVNCWVSLFMVNLNLTIVWRKDWFSERYVLLHLFTFIWSAVPSIYLVASNGVSNIGHVCFGDMDHSGIGVLLPLGLIGWPGCLITLVTVLTLIRMLLSAPSTGPSQSSTAASKSSAASKTAGPSMSQAPKMPSVRGNPEADEGQKSNGSVNETGKKSGIKSAVAGQTNKIAQRLKKHRQKMWDILIKSWRSLAICVVFVGIYGIFWTKRIHESCLAKDPMDDGMQLDADPVEGSAKRPSSDDLLSTPDEVLTSHFGPNDLETAVRVLETLNANPDLKRLANSSVLVKRLIAAGHRAFRPTEDEKKSHSKKIRKNLLESDHAVLEETGIRKMRNVKMVGMAGGSTPIPRPPKIGFTEDNAKFIAGDEEKFRQEMADEAARLLSSGSVPINTPDNKRQNKDGTHIPKPSEADFTHVEAADEADAEKSLPPPKKLNYKRSCHICGAHFQELHAFYDQLCLNCAVFNYSKRFSKADMTGRVCIVTGARVKIGYAISLKLLRMNAAKVIVTTRFPHDAAKRYAAEPDAADFKNRLTIYGLDFRDIRMMHHFCAHIRAKETRLDVIINNAAQTVRKPPGFYEHLMSGEAVGMIGEDVLKNVEVVDVFRVGDRYLFGSPDVAAAEAKRLIGSQNGSSSSSGKLKQVQGGDLATSAVANDGKILMATPAQNATTLATDYMPSAPGSATALASNLGSVVATSLVNEAASMSQIALLAGDVTTSTQSTQLFPVGLYDRDDQQVDLRSTNSWNLELGQISTIEMMECHTINTFAPWVLISELKGLMESSGPPDGSTLPAGSLFDKYIVNVSAMEGQFYRSKQKFHPHTNMAKASLNMMTWTAAKGFAEVGIFMTAVDTGWITDEQPQHLWEKRELQPPPLDEWDAAMRVLDPALSGIRGEEKVWGVFLKNYKPTRW
ncbi:hypothetical protein HDU77_002820 [Chytriomyces hyalinus]|nr:hypothetical protein HDU77_002820 [Chytriomyces hyalinus]